MVTPYFVTFPTDTMPVTMVTLKHSSQVLGKNDPSTKFITNINYTFSLESCQFHSYNDSSPNRTDLSSDQPLRNIS